MMIIYEIVCNITGERYIGSTTTLLKYRIQKHVYGAKSNHPKSNYRSKEIINRGDYVVNVLEEGEFGMEREQYYMDMLDNINDRQAVGYNMERKKARDKAKDRLRCKDPKRMEYNKIYNAYRRTWGGDCRTHNNLLLISMDLFK